VEEFYTLQQIADMLQMHPETVRELVRRKELAAYKVGRRDYRVRKVDFDKFMEQRRTIDDDNQK
jgi:excisionase family DNA binding protein